MWFLLEILVKTRIFVKKQKQKQNKNKNKNKQKNLELHNSIKKKSLEIQPPLWGRANFYWNSSLAPWPWNAQLSLSPGWFLNKQCCYFISFLQKLKKMKYFNKFDWTVLITSRCFTVHKLKMADICLICFIMLNLKFQTLYSYIYSGIKGRGVF